MSPGRSKRRAGVTSLVSADLGCSGAEDIVVGREDGQLEIWSVGDLNPAVGRLDQTMATLAFETSVNESIRALDTGAVTTGNHLEIVLTTFSGKVLGFTPDQAARDATGATLAQQEETPAVPDKKPMFGKKKEKQSVVDEKAAAVEKGKRLKNLQNEVEKLKAAVEQEKQKYAQKSSEGIAVQSTTKVEHKFYLNSEEACYVLDIQSQSPIEMVALRGAVFVDLLDSDSGSAETGGGILSRSRGDPANPLLATYRMQVPVARFQIRMRTVEGEHGDIACFVLPQTQPKTAHLINLSVKPLSLHEKVTTQPADVPMNELRLNGPFTLMDMHQWLSQCVNEMPSRPTDDEISIVFRSTFVGSWLLGRYGKGSAVMRSDSITTISVLKDVITREATARKIQMSISVDVKDETFPWFLELIHPKMSFQHSLTQQVRLVEPLREMQLQENDTKFLTPELQKVLQHGSEIQQQFEMQPARLSFLHNVICESYKHKCRLKGHISVEHKLKDLQRVLENYSLEQVIAFFDEPV